MLVWYDVSIVGYDVCQYGMMLVSQVIVGYDMVYITHACMTQCYDVNVWYGYDVKKLRIAIMLKS